MTTRTELAEAITARKAEIIPQAVERAVSVLTARITTEAERAMVDGLTPHLAAAVDAILSAEAYTTVMRATDQQITDWAMRAIPAAHNLSIS